MAFLRKANGGYLLLSNGGKIILSGPAPVAPTPPAVLNPQNGVGKSDRDKYSFLIYINGALFADLTGIAKNRKFSKIRNDSDDITFDVSLDELEEYAKSSGINSQDILQAGISECRISRNGIVLTAGWLSMWTSELADERTISLQFKGWFELLKFRFTTSAYITPTALTIIQQEIATTQAKPFGNIGFQFGAVPSPDTTNAYPTKEYTNKALYDIFTELSNDDLGLDFEFTWDKKINIYHPRQGIIRQDIVFSYPGTIEDIKSTNDATKLANDMTDRGAGYGSVQFIKDANDPFSQQKYGLFEGFADHSDITDDTQLQNLANSDLALYKQPIVLHEITLDGNQDPQVGSFNIGDSVRISVTSLLSLYSGFNNFFTIDRYDVDLSDEGEEKVKVSVH